MQRSHRAAIFSIGAVLSLVCAVALAGLLLGSVSPFPGFGSHVTHVAAFHDLVVASPALLALRGQVADYEARATAKLAEITPDLAPDAVRAIETDYDAIVTQLDATRAQVRALETAPPAPAPDAAAQLRADRQRSADIQEIGRRSGLTQEVIDAAVTDGTSTDLFRTRAWEHMAERSAAQPRTPPGRIHVTGQEDDEKRGAALENALMHRFDPRGVQLTDQGRQFRGMTLLEMGSECLESRGIKTRGMSKHERSQAMLNMRSEASEIAIRSGGSMSTSDFPNVLANVANKTLRQGYAAAPQTFRPLVRVVTVPDFKMVSRVQLGEAPQLEKVRESGEFARGKMGDSAERYAVSTYGKIVSITRQVIINDDLDAFTRIPRSFGVAAANLESDLVWAEIVKNPKMGDGKTLFHADHKNIGTGMDLTTEGVSAGREAMRMQTGLDGKTLLNITPVYLIVPVAMETAAEKFLGQIYPTRTEDGVPSSMRKLVPISEPRLDTESKTRWYLAGDPAAIDVVELAYLEGMEGLYTETRMGFDVDGVEVKVRQDVGAKAIDHRGLFRS